MIFSFFLYLLGENKFIYSDKLLPLNTNLISPIQKHPQNIESYTCIF